jgi:hypothetical protein
MATATISCSIEEKVGLPQYSNVTIGPVTITRECDDTPEARKALREEIHAELREDLAKERGIVLEAIKAFAKDGGYGDVRN